MGCAPRAGLASGRVSAGRGIRCRVTRNKSEKPCRASSHIHVVRAARGQMSCDALSAREPGCMASARVLIPYPCPFPCPRCREPGPPKGPMAMPFAGKHKEAPPSSDRMPQLYLERSPVEASGCVRSTSGWASQGHGPRWPTYCLRPFEVYLRLAGASLPTATAVALDERRGRALDLAFPRDNGRWLAADTTARRLTGTQGVCAFSRMLARHRQTPTRVGVKANTCWGRCATRCWSRRCTIPMPRWRQRFATFCSVPDTAASTRYAPRARRKGWLPRRDGSLPRA
jgi:hypothetical protein